MAGRKLLQLQNPKFKLSYCTLPAGFTLLEVLIAMGIFSISLLGLGIGATSIMRANQTSYFNTLATNWAQDKLEELKAKTVSSLPSCPPTYPGGSNCSDTKTSSGLNFTRNWQIQSDSPVAGTTRIDVKVDWTDYKSNSLTISSAVKQ